MTRTAPIAAPAESRAFPIGTGNHKGVVVDVSDSGISTVLDASSSLPPGCRGAGSSG
jgi:hypothetical protein